MFFTHYPTQNRFVFLLEVLYSLASRDLPGGKCNLWGRH
ncbi:hypothetical protein CES85_4911 [Ochrobactrum quorumnocens]|uniref:Uncharacterized protein n=1 Tax=Ochrobactrum quorumnocens TaxID=271865 RepID=A0A248UCQ6_9HYPH|nr:hypothetical protein CES85_4911 [[Ochrobactrum] quorumnocens]